MSSSRNHVEQSRVDAVLRQALGDLATPTLAEDFAPELERRLPRRTPVTWRRTVRRAMRAYWTLFIVASLILLGNIGSASPSVTWMIIVSLVAALLASTVPQFLFRGPRRTNLLDLILESIR